MVFDSGTGVLAGPKHMVETIKQDHLVFNHTRTFAWVQDGIGFPCCCLLFDAVCLESSYLAFKKEEKHVAC